MARAATYPVRRFDPTALQRHVLKHPDGITFFNPHSGRQEHDKGGLIVNLTEYCYSGGITISPEQIEKFRMTRNIGRRGQRRIGRAPIDVAHLVSMTKLLYYGQRSQLFMDLLHHYGWWSTHEHGPVEPPPTRAEMRRHGQRELNLFPGR